MNSKKICFIYCVNNEKLYHESIKYINSLDIPNGFESDIIAIKNAKSISEGYNRAMQQTDAKYKVYLHQDVFIINKQFIHDIIKVFEENDQLGMLGVVGAKTLPSSVVWWEAEEKYGKVLDSHRGRIEALNFQDVKGEYEEVQAIDGLLMITQYDIVWREDIIKGWHFYDISQSLEFYRAGYVVGVPRQTNFWSIHDCGIVNVSSYDREREKFIKEYLSFQ